MFIVTFKVFAPAFKSTMIFSRVFALAFKMVNAAFELTMFSSKPLDAGASMVDVLSKPYGFGAKAGGAFFVLGAFRVVTLYPIIPTKSSSETVSIPRSSDF